MKRILFVCSGNTCRSVMAEYIARCRFNNRVEAASAGVRPGSPEDASNAIFTLKQVRIDASAHIPRDLRHVDLSDFDLIVTMDNHVAQELKRLYPELADSRITKWRIKDPYGDDLAEYRSCSEVICRQLKVLLGRASGRD